MIIYFVGDRMSDIEQLVSMGVRNVLVSYVFALQGVDLKEVKELGVERIFLDSGSHTAKSMTAEEQDEFLPVDEYIKYLKENEKYVTVASCMDRKRDFEYTYKKWRYMVSKGAKCIPVFQGSIYRNLEVMDEYLRHGNYIALSGSTKERGGTDEDALFNHKKIIMQYPNVKFHGFGLTSLSAIRNGLYYSVDSSSWLVTRQYGYILYFNPFHREIESINAGRFMYWKDSPMEFRKLLGYYPEWAERYNIKSIQDLDSPKKSVTVLIETLYKPLCKYLGWYLKNFRDD